ncbi:3-oxoacyl-[acyl-carrier-protein] reductase FabG-like [Epargyreus clarus]|uniref:3-oxoacyl-[acyl-carrier-protein] reductase FabG-like n=1 Tax=Epargyreus clarus TaxID=520877 RepID=UPI003C2BBE95
MSEQVRYRRIKRVSCYYTASIQLSVMEFEQKVVIITGASSGIGEACAQTFAKAGALLSIVGRNVENLDQVAKKCAEYGNKPLVIKADISVAEDVEKIVKNTVAHYGKIDVLVNNAGMLRIAGLMDDISNFDQMVGTNIRGTYLLSQKAIPHLIESKGNIVTVSSVVSTITEPVIMQYSMTKAALDAFTRCAASELGPKGVRVNAVNPGPVFTNLFVRSGLTDEDYKTKFEEVRTSMRLKKIAEPEDVANLVAFLASDRAKCITGSFHYIDGGLHLGNPVLRP